MPSRAQRRRIVFFDPLAVPETEVADELSDNDGSPDGEEYINPPSNFRGTSFRIASRLTNDG
ncbi:MAG: hypothetical protein OHK0029_41280 [Armatimonadaceae bacterium]